MYIVNFQSVSAIPVSFKYFPLARNCRDGVALPDPTEEKCSIFEQTVGSAVMDFKVRCRYLQIPVSDVI